MQARVCKSEDCHTASQPDARQQNTLFIVRLATSLALAGGLAGPVVPATLGRTGRGVRAQALTRASKEPGGTWKPLIL
jgi:hypothetical protein